MSRRVLVAEAGYVLAGGASRRMGRDKALLEDGGKPLAARVAEIVAAAAGGCSIVAPEGRYEGLGFPVLGDLWPGEGPLGGVLTALAADAAEWNLIVAVDMPFLDAEFLKALLREARAHTMSVVPAHSNGDLEPLCGVYRGADREALQGFFDGGGRRMKDALREIPLRTVPAPAAALRNLNTPEQWEAART